MIAEGHVTLAKELWEDALTDGLEDVVRGSVAVVEEPREGHDVTVQYVTSLHSGCRLPNLTPTCIK